jgi:hypothetical protein
MRNNLKIALLFLGIFTLIISGCKRNRCFHCYLLDGNFQYSKNGDTFGSAMILNRQWLQDSVNLYISRGYKIDTVFSQYGDAGIICDTPPPGPYPSFPDSCVFSYSKL